MSARHRCEASTWRHVAPSQQSSEVDAADDSDAVNGQFSDFYSAVIIRQRLFSPSVQPLFDLVLKLHGLALSGLAISASPTVCPIGRTERVFAVFFRRFDQPVHAGQRWQNHLWHSAAAAVPARHFVSPFVRSEYTVNTVGLAVSH